ncbi:MAG: AbrB/MazE/SpoVT family DNA-binding domain-containing protein [Candidatus Freyarchaeota archaeon]|nr:hypothetical protein [Candidatus Freyarchaeota archaeon]MDO8090384.1 hypothetical protein [Candidatus Sigynarchaeota archaeon]
MSEVILKVGKRGEIYTNREIREKSGIKPGGFVKAVVRDSKLIIEGITSIEEVIKNRVLELSPEEAERLSEEAQKERGGFG